MTRKTVMTPITPEIRGMLDVWYNFAKVNHLMVNDKGISDLGFKAKACLEYAGACICKPRERLVCPCPQCVPECQTKSMCFCHIFCSLEWYNAH